MNYLESLNYIKENVPDTTSITFKCSSIEVINYEGEGLTLDTDDVSGEYYIYDLEELSNLEEIIFKYKNISDADAKELLDTLDDEYIKELYPNLTDIMILDSTGNLISKNYGDTSDDTCINVKNDNTNAQEHVEQSYQPNTMQNSQQMQGQQPMQNHVTPNQTNEHPTNKYKEETVKDKILNLKSEGFRELTENEKTNFSMFFRQNGKSFSLSGKNMVVAKPSDYTITYVGFLEGLNSMITNQQKANSLAMDYFQAKVGDITTDYNYIPATWALTLITSPEKFYKAPVEGTELLSKYPYDLSKVHIGKTLLGDATVDFTDEANYFLKIGAGSRSGKSALVHNLMLQFLTMEMYIMVCDWKPELILPYENTGIRYVKKTEDTDQSLRDTVDIINLFCDIYDVRASQKYSTNDYIQNVPVLFVFDECAKFYYGTKETDDEELYATVKKAVDRLSGVLRACATYNMRFIMITQDISSSNCEVFKTGSSKKITLSEWSSGCGKAVMGKGNLSFKDAKPLNSLLTPEQKKLIDVEGHGNFATSLPLIGLQNMAHIKAYLVETKASKFGDNKFRGDLYAGNLLDKLIKEKGVKLFTRNDVYSVLGRDYNVYNWVSVNGGSSFDESQPFNDQTNGIGGMHVPDEQYENDEHSDEGFEQQDTQIPRNNTQQYGNETQARPFNNFDNKSKETFERSADPFNITDREVRQASAEPRQNKYTRNLNIELKRKFLSKLDSVSDYKRCSDERHNYLSNSDLPKIDTKLIRPWTDVFVPRIFTFDFWTQKVFKPNTMIGRCLLDSQWAIRSQRKQRGKCLVSTITSSVGECRNVRTLDIYYDYVIVNDMILRINGLNMVETPMNHILKLYNLESISFESILLFRNFLNDCNIDGINEIFNIFRHMENVIVEDMLYNVESLKDEKDTIADINTDFAKSTYKPEYIYKERNTEPIDDFEEEPIPRTVEYEPTIIYAKGSDYIQLEEPKSQEVYEEDNNSIIIDYDEPHKTVNTSYNVESQQCNDNVTKQPSMIITPSNEPFNIQSTDKFIDINDNEPSEIHKQDSYSKTLNEIEIGNLDDFINL